MKAIENLNKPFTRNFKQNANARKFSRPLAFNAHHVSYLTKTQNFDLHSPRMYELN